MRFIGITGGVGAGKSAILSYLAKKERTRVMLADEIAHDLMKPGTSCYDKLKQCFGKEDIYLPDGNFDRNKMAAVIFGDDAKRAQLNAIVHPAVKTWILNEIGQQKQNHICKLFVIEAALLIEDGYTEICDEIWYIYAEESVRVKRLMESRGYSLDKCRAVMQNQSEEAYYRKNTSARIDNSLTFAETEKQVDALLKS